MYCGSKLYSLCMVYSFIYIQQDLLICFETTKEGQNILLPNKEPYTMWFTLRNSSLVYFRWDNEFLFYHIFTAWYFVTHTTTFSV